MPFSAQGLDKLQKELYNDNCSSGYVSFITDGDGR